MFPLFKKVIKRETVLKRIEEYKEEEKHHYNQKYEARLLSIEETPNSYDEVNENAIQYFNAIVKNIIKRRGDISILDYGCGTGEKSVQLIGKDTKLRGIDISEKSIELANSKYSNIPNVSFEVMDCEKTIFPDNSFDMIFDYGTFSSIDINKAINEITRILKPEGYLICIETLGHNPIINFMRRRSAKYGKRTQWASSHIMRINNWQHIQKMFVQSDIRHFNILAIFFAPIMQFLPSKISSQILDFVWSVDNHLVTSCGLSHYAFKTVACFHGIKK
jgi:ubiquinone/menaquinone biosynthesis C-methylase UbiE